MITFSPSGCWADERTERPSFGEILIDLQEAQEDAFFDTAPDDFSIVQDSWLQEIADEDETVGPLLPLY